MSANTLSLLDAEALSTFGNQHLMPNRDTAFVLMPHRDEPGGPAGRFEVRVFSVNADWSWTPKAASVDVGIDVSRIVGPPSIAALPGGAGMLVTWSQLGPDGMPVVSARILDANGVLGEIASVPAHGTAALDVPMPGGGSHALSVVANEAGDSASVSLLVPGGAPVAAGSFAVPAPAPVAPPAPVAVEGPSQTYAGPRAEIAEGHALLPPEALTGIENIHVPAGADTMFVVWPVAKEAGGPAYSFGGGAFSVAGDVWTPRGPFFDLGIDAARIAAPPVATALPGNAGLAIVWGELDTAGNPRLIARAVDGQGRLGEPAILDAGTSGTHELALTLPDGTAFDLRAALDHPTATGIGDARVAIVDPATGRDGAALAVDLPDPVVYVRPEPPLARPEHPADGRLLSDEVLAGFGNVHAEAGRDLAYVLAATRASADGPTLGYRAAANTVNADWSWTRRGDFVDLGIDAARIVAPPAIAVLPGDRALLVTWSALDETGEPRLYARVLDETGRLGTTASFDALDVGTATHSVPHPAGGSVTLAVAVAAPAGGRAGDAQVTLPDGRTLDLDVPDPVVYVGPSAPAPESTPTPQPPGPAPVPPTTGPVVPDPGDIAEGTPSLGYNLGYVRDWGSNNPFLDHFKVSRPWIAERDWANAGSQPLDLDRNGWVRSIPEDGAYDAVSTVLFTGGRDAHPRGIYVVRWEGEGTLQLAGDARIDAARSGDGRIVFEHSGEGSVVLRLLSSDPDGTGDYLRDIQVVEEHYEPLLDAGEIFHPIFLERVEDMRTLRFHHWGRVEEGATPGFAATGNVDSARYSDDGGVPVDVMVKLAKQVGADPWLTTHFDYTDAEVRAMARAVLAELGADRDRVVTVEFGNENWNTAYTNTQEAIAIAARELSGVVHGGYLQYAGVRAAEVARIWREEFAADGRAEQLRAVMSVHPGSEWLAERSLLAPDYVAQHGVRPPYEAFDAVATTGYFGHGIFHPRNHEILRQWMAEPDGGFASLFAQLREGGRIVEDEWSNTNSLAELAAGFRAQAAMAERYGIELLVYEGGSHMADPFDPGAMPDDIYAFNLAAHRHPEMGAIYRELFEAWRDAGGGEFVVYSDTYAFSRYGAFGTYENPHQAETPRSEAVDGFNEDRPAWWGDMRGADAFDYGRLVFARDGETSLAGGDGDDRILAGHDVRAIDGGDGEDTLVLGNDASRWTAEDAGGGVFRFASADGAAFETRSVEYVRFGAADPIAIAALAPDGLLV